jgi:hypothetical protein
MTKYHQKVIMKTYDEKHIHNWTGTQLTHKKNITINLKMHNVTTITRQDNKKRWNNNGNKCKDIKNNNKTYKTSLLTSTINKKIETR